MTAFIEMLKELYNIYGMFLLTGIIGSIVHRALNKMTIGRFLRNVVVSTFISLLVCICIKNFTEWSTEVIFVGGCVGGFFSVDIIKEGREIINGLSDIVKEKLGKGKKDSTSDENQEA